MNDDLMLQKRVTDELDWEPSVDVAHIGVTAKNGVVTLTGFVETYAARAAAEAAAGRVKGVTAIAQEIEVRFPDSKTADDEIAERAVRILEWDVEVPEGPIRIRISHGRVTITGSVGQYFQRKTAENAIKRLSGVRSISNEIEVAPAIMSQPTASAIRARIDEALRRRADVEANSIDIAVDRGKVALTGTVRSWSERGIIRHAAAWTPGVKEVDDRLHVQPLPDK